MGRLIDADAFRNKLVEMKNDPFASTNSPLNWSHAYESVMVELDRMPNAQGWISVSPVTHWMELPEGPKEEK